MIPLPPMAITREGVTFIVNDPESPPGNPHFWSPRMTWETETYAALAEHLKPGRVLWDVGAWVGPFSLWAAALGAIVWAFEPDPVAHRALFLNTRAQKAEGWVNVLPYGCGSGEDVTLWTDEWGDSTASGRRKRTTKARRITTTRLDDFIADTGGPPDVIKIDCEGMEGEVLAGAMETIVEHRPVIILSTHPGYLFGADWRTIDRVARIYGATIDHEESAPHVLSR